MCMIIKDVENNGFKEAKNDVECFKLLIFENNHYWSPFQYERYNVGEVYYDKNFKNEIIPLEDDMKSMMNNMASLYDNGGYVLNAIHSYKNYEDILAAKSVFEEAYPKDGIYSIAKCVIPAGSLYAEGLICSGMENDGDFGFVSNAIRIEEIVEV